MTPVSKAVHNGFGADNPAGGPDEAHRHLGRDGMADSQSSGRTGASAVDSRAADFVGARLAGRVLLTYPGALPGTVDEAYAIQNQAIAAWPDEIAGWKVGRINPPFDVRYGTDRLAGPIFSRQLSHAGAAPGEIHLFKGGFGAVEGEVVIELAQDAPVSKTSWTLSEAAELAGIFRLGVEVASSPFPGINDYGPLVTISDFGNNNGLILGDEIPGAKRAQASDWHLRTLIDGVEVGAANAASIPGGPLESLRAVLEICARNGHPLRRGMQVTTGAVTGVHPIRPGQSATIEMAGLRPVNCRAVAVPIREIT